MPLPSPFGESDPSSFKEVKRRPDGHHQLFPCRLLARDGEGVILHYRLSEAREVDAVRLQPGDSTIAYFWTSRPYNVYHWLGPDGATRGYYFNIARDTIVSGDRVEWTDLGLDLLVLADGRTFWIDEAEVSSLGEEDRQAVGRARRHLEEEYARVVAEVANRSALLRAQVA